jgi:hypothetical protein
MLFLCFCVCIALVTSKAQAIDEMMSSQDDVSDDDLGFWGQAAQASCGSGTQKSRQQTKIRKLQRALKNATGKLTQCESQLTVALDAANAHCIRSSDRMRASARICRRRVGAHDAPAHDEELQGSQDEAPDNHRSWTREGTTVAAMQEMIINEM